MYGGKYFKKLNGVIFMTDRLFNSRNSTCTNFLGSHPFWLASKTWTINAASANISASKTASFTFSSNLRGKPLIHLVSATLYNQQVTNNFGTMRIQINIDLGDGSGSAARAIQGTRFATSASSWLKSVNAFAFQVIEDPGVGPDPYQVTFSYFITGYEDKHTLLVRNAFVTNGAYNIDGTPSITCTYA